ncbi:MAG: hypothetical protein ACK6A5_16110 [Flavobacteriales bacterium]
MRKSICTLALLLAHHVHAQSLLGSSGSGGGGTGNGSLLGNGIIAGLELLQQALNTDPVSKPRDFEPRLLMGVGVCLQEAHVEDSTRKASGASYPWLGGLMELGASVTYRDRLGLALVGATGLNGYRAKLDTMNYLMYHATKRAEARLWWTTLPHYDRPKQWKFGLALGCTFQRPDELVHERNGLHAATTAPAAIRPYLAPEIGRLNAEGRDRYEVSLRYVAHLGGSTAWQSNVSTATHAGTYSATDNYFAVMTRFHIGVPHKPVPEPPPTTVPYMDRETDTLATMASRQRRITLRMWDDAEIDGDTISVLLNNVPVLSAYGLQRRPLRVPLDLRRGNNHLMVIAHNEGAVAPNTATCIVRRGRGKEKLLIKTSHKQNQLVVIRNG